MQPKVGIIGSGIVAQSLATGFLNLNYEVKLGTREPEKLKEWASKPNCSVGTFKDAAAFGSLLVLAVKGSVAKDALDMCGKENLSGKTIIDATNPIADVDMKSGVIKFFTPAGESLMEQLQKAYPESFFVKAFNSVGATCMVNPDFGGIKPTMFICGNNELSRKEVTEILDKFGWETEDMGSAEAARPIESLCILWCIPGFRKNDWSHAFKLLR